MQQGTHQTVNFNYARLARGVVHWYRMPNGKAVSYRFQEHEAASRHRGMLKRGAVEIQDPFRKGAPAGGFQKNRPLYVFERQS